MAVAAQEPAPERSRPEPALAPTGAALYEARCASCHANPGTTKAPALPAMRGMSASAVMFAMTNGKMKAEAAGLSFPEMLAITQHVAGTDQPYFTPAAARCKDPSIDLTPRVARWGFDDHNTGRIPAGVSSVDSRNVASLDLLWAFGLPHSADARSQPAVTEDTLFVAAVSGVLFALDRLSGCIKWQYDSPVPLRTALTLGEANGRTVLFFGDAASHVNAVDAHSGEAIWRTEARVGEHSILTGAVVQTRERLIVPVSSYEVAIARDPAHECCRTHGAVMSMNAATGAIQWVTELTEDAKPTGKTEQGVTRWGPSGVAVWSTPTIDEARDRIYIGTAQNASAPATEYSDSVLALAIDTGEIVWHYQAFAGDTYNDACSSFPPGPNCPERPGPDFDIGASVVLARNRDGKDILLAGQKSGDVYALDPDTEGRVLWHARVGAGSPLGGVHWGLAVTDRFVIVPISDPEYPFPNYFPKPGLYALDLDTGKLAWERRGERGCETTIGEYFARAELYPDCSFYYGFSAAPTVVNDVVFAPTLDGRVHAFAVTDGTPLWQFETARAFATVNEVEAHGGSIDSAGVQAVGRMVYVQSGYSLFGELPGNVLLAFELD